MSNVSKRSVSLSAEQAAFVDAKVTSGDYASASEVVRDGLRALQSRDAAIERWLREEVAPAYDAMRANPDSGSSVDEVEARLATRLGARVERDRTR